MEFVFKTLGGKMDSVFEEVKKIIGNYYSEQLDEFYVPESIIKSVINLLAEKTSFLEHFCIYKKEISTDLFYSALVDILLHSDDNFKFKRFFFFFNVLQVDDFLSKRLMTQKNDNIENNIILLSNVATEKMPEIRNFIIFDNEIVLTLDSDIDGGYILSTNSKLLNDCKRWFTDISTINLNKLEYFFLQEPLMRSANMMNEIALVMCSHDHVNSESCYWYHSTWQYLRLMDMVSTPSWHHDFYLEQIQKICSSMKRVNVLISGAADYSSLSYVVRAIESLNIDAHYTVLDLCETPLFSWKWYAKLKNISVDTKQQSIFELEDINKYDIICTDAFLTRFSKDKISKIISLWNNALCDGGHVITTVRIHDEKYQCPNFPSNKDIENFKNKAIERMKIWGGFINCTVEEMSQKAEIYAKKMHSNHIGNRQDIIDLFNRNGFEIIKIEDVEVNGELYLSRYLRINAKKVGD